MSKFNPPQINSIIPAFTGELLTIPFFHNITINEKEIIGFQVNIKDLYNKQIINEFTRTYDLTQGFVYFNLDRTLLTLGNYYKVQIAYVNNNNEIGHYSAIGTTKFTSMPKVTILGLTPSINNPIKINYTGVFTQPINGDITEKLYSSYFIIYDANNNILYQTEEKIHNGVNDVNINEQIENISFNYEFLPQTLYKIQFITKSLNGVLSKSFRYFLIKEDTIPIELDGTLMAENIYDDGYVHLFITNSSNIHTNGSFILSRLNTKTQKRLILKYFNFNYENPNLWTYNDYSIEQGQEYLYSIQQYNSAGLYSNDLFAEPIYADYEDMFLYDGKKQLKIKFNPSVSSFKTTILEQKIDTIGSKYPFIFRNGHVNYKEFPIGGLLSYLEDNEQYFYTEDIETEARAIIDALPNGICFNNKTNLIGNTFEKERFWKLNVLDWLNNGEIKLFKSPAEGVYLIRLTGVSLTPNEQLGRLLHSFTATAYEIADINEENLNNFNIINSQMTSTGIETWESWDLSNYKISDREIILNNSQVYGLRAIGLLPGTSFDILIEGAKEYQTIVIGATGAYEINNITIAAVRLTSNHTTGIISYKTVVDNSGFKLIDTIVYHPAQLFSLNGNFQNYYEREYKNRSKLFFLQTNNKIAINKINLLHCEKLPLIVLDPAIDIADIVLDSNFIYYKNNYLYYGDQTIQNKYLIGPYEDITLDDIYCIWVNGEKIDLTNKNMYNINIEALGNNPQLYIGLGVKIDLGFSLKEYVYKFENDIERQKFLNLNINEIDYNNYINFISSYIGRGQSI